MNSKNIIESPKNVEPGAVSQTRYTEHYLSGKIKPGMTLPIAVTGRQFVVGWLPCAIKWSTDTGLDGVLQPYGNFDTAQDDYNPFNKVSLWTDQDFDVVVDYEITASITNNPAPLTPLQQHTMEIDNTAENPVNTRAVVIGPVHVEGIAGDEKPTPVITEFPTDYVPEVNVKNQRKNGVSIQPALLTKSYTRDIDSSQEPILDAVFNQNFLSALPELSLNLDEFMSAILAVTFTLSKDTTVDAYISLNENLGSAAPVAGIVVRQGETRRIYTNRNQLIRYVQRDDLKNINFYSMITLLIDEDFYNKNKQILEQI